MSNISVNSKILCENQEYYNELPIVRFIKGPLCYLQNIIVNFNESLNISDKFHDWNWKCGPGYQN